jgi:hypothetical protein
MGHEPSKKQPCMSFSRMFMIVPFDKEWCVMKEELSVTDATGEERKVHICLVSNLQLVCYGAVVSWNTRRSIHIFPLLTALLMIQIWEGEGICKCFKTGN